MGLRKGFDDIFSKATIFVACAPLGFEKLGSEIRPRVCVILIIVSFSTVLLLRIW